jgi:release factor glutamine methyltransferase
VPEARQEAAAGTVRQALAAASDALAAAGVESPRLDAELLLAAAAGLDRAQLAADHDRGVGAPAARSFGAMVRRRVMREPVAYILGSKGFRHIELRCDPRGLVPRPETELLVEIALERRPRSLLDVGTGTGAIALAVADELPEAEVVAIDTSPEALALARENAAALGLEGRVAFELGSLPAPRHFDLVLANLPYVADRDWQGLPPEITRHEPREALLGGADGLDPIRGLLAAFAEGSEPRRAGLACDAIALEIGTGQYDEVSRLVAEAGFAPVAVRDDLAGIGRVVVGG